jgi:tetratricopeptide (TPR) repeat protein
MAWIKSAAGGAGQVLTICYGSFIAARLGLLDGLEATTWYGSVSAMAAEYPRITTRPGVRFVDNGKIITTAGVSAGIDGALHLVGRTLGRYVADRVAEYMEYPWAPPSRASSTYAQLNPRLDSRGRRLQEATIAASGGDFQVAIAIYRDLIAAQRDAPEVWLRLGVALHSSGQYAEAAAAYSEAAKGTNERASALYNLACAEALLGEKEKALDAVARAIAAGFRSRGAYERDPDLASIRADARFGKMLAALP